MTDPPRIGMLVDRLAVTRLPRGPDERDAVFAVERHFRKTSAADRIFGGQLAAQMLLAAQATVPPEKSAIAMHVDYLAFGDREAPLQYQVEHTSAGRTELRRVVARQGDATAVGSITFQPPGGGFEHHQPIPPAPPPDDLAPHWRMDGRGFQVRSEEGHDPFERAATDTSLRMWWRTDGPVPDDPGLHQAVLAYIGDLTMTAGPFRPLEGYAFDMWEAVVSATVNYAIWFHRPFRVDEWLLHDQSTPSAAGGRALTLSHWYTAEGALAATCAQQTASRLR